jgi:hypothetical protein
MLSTNLTTMARFAVPSHAAASAGFTKMIIVDPSEGRRP